MPLHALALRRLTLLILHTRLFPLPPRNMKQEEMAAILRFGAEDLFKEDAAAEEAHGAAVMAEDLDAILERAEVGAAARAVVVLWPCGVL